MNKYKNFEPKTTIVIIFACLLFFVPIFVARGSAKAVLTECDGSVNCAPIKPGGSSSTPTGGGSTTKSTTPTAESSSSSSSSLPPVDNPPKPDCKERPMDKSNCQIVNYLVITITTLSALVGIVVTIMIVWGGILYSSAKDNPQQTAKAKEVIRNAVIALVFYFFMFAFLQWIIPGGIV